MIQVLVTLIICLTILGLGFMFLLGYVVRLETSVDIDYYDDPDGDGDPVLPETLEETEAVAHQHLTLVKK